MGRSNQELEQPGISHRQSEGSFICSLIANREEDEGDIIKGLRWALVGMIAIVAGITTLFWMMR